MESTSTGDRGTTIGGTTAGAGNLISGNSSAGVLIQDGAQPALDNLVIGNKIGTDITGTAALPNQGDGLDLFASNNTIGGTSPADLNLISANQGNGINISEITNPANNNVIQGNYIGTDVTGRIALGNAFDGISDNFDSNNTIGGGSAGSGNLISANTNEGVDLFSVSGDLVTGNIIGTTPGQITDAPFEFQPLGNGGDGIRVGGTSTHNTIGLPGAGNLVVCEQKQRHRDQFRSRLQFGLGQCRRHNSRPRLLHRHRSSCQSGQRRSNGIYLNDVSANTIGGADEIAAGNITLLGGNVVSSNGQAGIDVSGNDLSLPGNQGNVILGNLVGTNAEGSSGLLATRRPGSQLDSLGE